MKLTSKNYEVCKLIANGLTDDEISKELNIPLGTVKNRIARLLHHNNLRNRVQLAVKFVKENGDDRG